MSEIGEIYDAMRKESQRHRAMNREKAVSLLDSLEAKFTVHNDGARIIIAAKVGRVDFWPGTGRIKHEERTLFGFAALVELLGRV